MGNLALKFADAVNLLLEAAKKNNSANANTIYHLSQAALTAPDITVQLTVHAPSMDMAAGKPVMGSPTLKEIKKDDDEAEAEDQDKEE